MRRNGIKKYVLFFSLFLCGLVPFRAEAQLSGQVKKFLWEKDFQTLIRKYGEDHITLHDAGDRVARLHARSYVEKPGLRVQVFAGTDRERASQIAEQVRALNLDSVYVLQQDRLFKVQVGNFRERREAEVMLDRLRFVGISNAWIVETTIHVPKSRVTSSAAVTSKTEPSSTRQVVFAVQLFVSGNRERALRFQRTASRKLPDRVWIQPQGELWKVMAGNYRQEEQARAALQRIRDAGYTDAWLTQTEIDEASEPR